MRKIFFNHSGFTFVESLITFSVTGIFLLLTWATVQFLLIKSNDQIIRTQAHFFAVEGIEILKQIRQTGVNKNRETGFLDSLGNKEGNFIITTSDGIFSLKSGTDEFLEMEQEPYMNFCRTIEISGEAEKKKIASIIHWGGTDCQAAEHTIRYTTYLADFKK